MGTKIKKAKPGKNVPVKKPVNKKLPLILERKKLQELDATSFDQIVRHPTRILSAEDCVMLHNQNIISEDEVREILGLKPKVKEEKPELQKPVAIRSLMDGSIEHLFLDGKRLIIPPISYGRITSFNQLPDPWKDTHFSSTPEQNQKAVDEFYDNAKGQDEHNNVVIMHDSNTSEEEPDQSEIDPNAKQE